MYTSNNYCIILISIMPYIIFQNTTFSKNINEIVSQLQFYNNVKYLAMNVRICMKNADMPLILIL